MRRQRPHPVRRPGESPGETTPGETTMRDWATVTFSGLVSVVLFYMMSVVSESYLVPGLWALCQSYGVPKDVAGGTLLAAGASLPEFVSNVVSMYVTKTDIGVGTVIGSEIFNHAAILAAVCGSSSSLQRLDRLTCVRDTLGYIGALILLCLAVSSVERQGSDDDVVNSVVAIRPLTTLPLVLWYGVYVVLCTSRGRTAIQQTFFPSSSEDDDDDDDPARWKKTLGGSSSSSKKTGTEATPLLKDDDDVLDEDSEPEDPTTAEEDDDDDKRHGQLSRWMSMKSLMWWDVVTLPVMIPLWATLPREPGKDPHLAVVISLIWLCLLSFGMVILLEAGAAVLGISTAVVGLTVGAIGTSFPNLVSAAASAKRGSADMAVSSALGANVYNLSIALGVPWLLYPVVHPHNPTFTGMHDASLTLLTFGLLGTALAYGVLLVASDWTLYPAFTFVFLLVYLGFLLTAIFAQATIQALENHTEGGH